VRFGGVMQKKKKRKVSQHLQGGLLRMVMAAVEPWCHPHQ